MRIRRLFNAMAAVALGLVLAACGGGGGGGPTTGVSTSSSGIVSKGIVKQGLVKAEELDASGNPLRTLGTATTDNSGQYSLSIADSYSGGPVLFTLSADANTTMVCDVQPTCDKAGITPFGNDFNVSSYAPNFKLTALIGSVTKGEAVTVQITPFTHMAATHALTLLADAANTASAKAKVDAANSKVNILLGGIDVLTTRPRDLSNAADLSAATSAEKAYAVLLSGIGQLALTDPAEPGLEDAIIKLGDSFKDGKIKSDEGEVADDAHYSLKELVDAAKAQQSAQDLTGEDAGVLLAMDDDITAAAGDDISPEPSPNAGDPDIIKAKALVQQVRNWGQSFNELETPANAFADEIDAADAATRVFQDSGGQALGNAALVLMLADLSDNGSYSYGPTSAFDVDLTAILGPGAAGSGTITRSTPDASQVKVRMVGTLVAKGQTNSVDITVTAVGTNSSGPVSAIAVQLTGTVENSGARLDVANGTEVTIGFSPAIDPVTATYAEMIAALHDMSLGGKFTLTQKAEVVGDPVAFTGEAHVDVVRCGSCTLNAASPEDVLNPSLIKFSGAFTKGVKSFEATTQATLNNATSYDHTLPDAGSNVADVSLSLSLKAKLGAALPLAQFTLTVNRTGYDTPTDTHLGDASLIIAYGGESLTIEATKSTTASGTVAITFTNQDGATLEVSGSEGTMQGNVKVGDHEVGEAKELGDNGLVKVSYNDGTFETVD